jgi:hypothetical protein
MSPTPLRNLTRATELMSTLSLHAAKQTRSSPESWSLRLLILFQKNLLDQPTVPNQTLNGDAA